MARVAATARGLAVVLAASALAACHWNWDRFHGRSDAGGMGQDADARETTDATFPPDMDVADTDATTRDADASDARSDATFVDMPPCLVPASVDYVDGSATSGAVVTPPDMLVHRGPWLTREETGDAGLYRLWWMRGASSSAPFTIVYREADRADGPWRGYRGAPDSAPSPVLPPGAPGDFDDYPGEPSVVKVAGTYYLYYTGHPNSPAGAIGVASSSNGVTSFTRRATPVLRGPSWPDAGQQRAVQPAAVYVDGTIYLAYTTTAPVAPTIRINVVRSTDPLFAPSTVQVVAGAPGARSWQPLASTAAAGIAVVESGWAGATLAYSDELDAFVVAYATPSGAAATLYLLFFDRAFEPLALGTGMIGVPLGNTDTLSRVALATDEQGHLRSASPCSGTYTLAVETVRAAGVDAGAQAMALNRFAISTGVPCGCRRAP